SCDIATETEPVCTVKRQIVQRHCWKRQCRTRSTDCDVRRGTAKQRSTGDRYCAIKSQSIRSNRERPVRQRERSTDGDVAAERYTVRAVEYQIIQRHCW